MTDWISAEAVPALLKPGMRVYIPGGVAEPRRICGAVAATPEATKDVTFIGGRIPGLDGADLGDSGARVTTFFMTPDLRPGFQAGRVDFVPMQYRAIWDYLERDAEIDAVFLHLSAPDENGNCSFGLRLDFQPAALASAKLVVAEINASGPKPPDMARLPMSRIDYAVEVDEPQKLLPAPRLTDAARRIGAHVVELVDDGDCIETGIGVIPNAVLDALRVKNDLGVHSGMIADGVYELARTGNVTGRAKTIDRGKIVTGFALGGGALYEWAGTSPELAYRTADYTHDGEVLRSIENFVAINSAVEVDLFGQVNAEMAVGRQISGTGGSVDFMRGAQRSKGGRSIVALNATARGGEISRIVPALPEGTVATALRTDADIFVTEYGVVRLKNLGLHDRAAALIAIADPKFRDGLREKWQSIANRL